MVRIISNDDIETHFRVEDYLPIAEETYRSLASDRASSTPTQTLLTPSNMEGETVSPPVNHELRVMGGAIEEFGVSGYRIDSDITHWPERYDSIVRERIPAIDGEYLGLVFLFDVDNGELLAIVPDGLIQTFHVAGGIAIGAKYLARDDAEQLGLFGTGHQARAHLPALDAALDLERIHVYSPTREHREEFAAAMDGRLAATVEAVDSPKEACANADVVNCCTNSEEPVFEMEWIEPGTHVGYLEPPEVPRELLDPDTTDVFVFTKPKQESIDVLGMSGYTRRRQHAADPWHYYVIPGEQPFPKFEHLPDAPQKVDALDVVRLPEIVADPSLGRSNDTEITALRQSGHAVAFTSIAYAIYELALEEGFGTDLPLDLFTQEYEP